MGTARQLEEELKQTPELTVITTPPLSRLFAKAKETVRADVLNAAPLIEEYTEAIEEYLVTIDRRDLVVWGTNPETTEGNRAIRVNYSPFWDALTKMGQRLDYIIENNERSAPLPRHSALSACEMFPNRAKADYERHAAHSLETRLKVAGEMAETAIAYYNAHHVGGDGRHPAEEDKARLERLADYILAEDHARGLLIIRDPYDKPSEKELGVPMGAGARAFLRTKLAQESAFAQVLDNLAAWKHDAYFNGDISCIEGILDVEAAIESGGEVSAVMQESGIVRSYMPDVRAITGEGVKLCECCGYPFEDKSRAGNSKVCGKSCAQHRDKMRKRIERYGTTELEGERTRMDIEYPFYAPNEMRSISQRSEKSKGDSDYMSRAIAAKATKLERGGKKTTIRIDDWMWTSNRNDGRPLSRHRAPEPADIVTYNTNENPLTPSFTDCQGIANRVCEWPRDTSDISA
ncbi:hypothetical protein [Paenibacillus caui]|uniref:hypothetical protein n=1 Tax=Paenibacillus caui TaxID=2873927 RepID=UPI001CA81324|nr:hypothetical protein [Paenibacillus caui]